MTKPTIKEKTSYCDSVPCTIHDHSGWLDRVKDYNPNQLTIKEKIDMWVDRESIGVRLLVSEKDLTDFARLICEELLGEPIPNEEEIDPIFKKAQVILKALE